MVSNMRKLVKQGYNKGNYEKFYNRESSKLTSFDKFMCDELISRLDNNSKILDFGCGIGLPHDKYFVKNKIRLTGIDISEKHIELAKKNVKDAKYMVGDFFSKEIKGKFNAIISFFAIFHIPRTEHKKLFSRMNYLLKSKGYILITLGAESMKCAVNPDFVGAPMAWSSYSVENNKKLISEAGFKILLVVEDYRTERHLWILAQKK
ncbi:MAG: class I SAM-dependent methyltransferase [Nanoarchaeota archaeon]|nr:class I SAM-dependent methyltransferase [Nanoarchaeota archaeon]